MRLIELAIGVAAVSMFAIGVAALARQVKKILRAPDVVPTATRKIHEATHEGYRVFTTEFDRVAGSHADVAGILDAPSSEQHTASESQWKEFQTGLDGLKPRLLTLAAGSAARIREALSETNRNDIVVTLLLDHSGSLRHRPILVTAASVLSAVECLRLSGIRMEVLAFTTIRWKGGLARRKWIAEGRVPEPGRLNDLLHIVYRNAEDNGQLDMDMFRTMLREDMLKENVDGEAVEWAEGRLLARREKRKLLILVSDGAPVDDSTIYENGLKYLPRHFESIVRRVERQGKVEAGEIFHSNTEFPVFARARKCESVETLGDELLALIEDMLLSEIAIVRSRSAVS